MKSVHSCLALVLALFATLPSAHAQNGGRDVELANLQEDVRLLTQQVGDLRLRLEQLERENGELRAKSGAESRAYATVAQLNEAVAEVNRTLKSSVSTSKAETLQIVSQQMRELGHQMNNALDELRKPVSAPVAAAAPTPQTTFSEDYPKEGIKYVVQKGDTLGVIAKKTGAKVSDIINANKIQNSAKILEGQTLFVPGGKQ